MAKARSHPDQLDLLSIAPRIATGPGALAGSAAQTARHVSEILKDDPRPREVMAAEMSVLLDEDVSKLMLDAYASPARSEHTISWHRMKSLLLVSGRVDIIDRELAPIGVSVLDADGLLSAELGQLMREEAEIRKRRRMLQSLAQSFGGDKHK